MKRLKRIVQWTAVVLGALVAILLIVNAWYVASSDSQLEKRWAQLRAKGHPISLADLAPSPIPPEENAATYLRRAQADVTALADEVCKRWNSMGTNTVPTADEQKAIREALDAYPKVVPLLEQAAAVPDYDAGLDYSVPQDEFVARLLPVMQDQRSVARALYAKAALLAAEGKRDEAVQTSILLLRLARHFDRCPVLVSYLVSIAIRGMAFDGANRALQAGAVSRETREALDAELALHEPMDGFRRVLVGELALMREMTGQMPGRHFWLVARGFWNREELHCLDAMDYWLTALPVNATYRQVQDAIRQTNSQMTGPLARLILPSLEATCGIVTGTQAEIRSLRVLNAIQAHAGTSEGAVPKLTDLGLPTATTTDPYNGQPLHVKRLPEGWIIYSVGRNLTDEGGDKPNDSNADVGVGPIKPPIRPEAQPASTASPSP
jgi:hypothetical protein